MRMREDFEEILAYYEGNYAVPMMAKERAARVRGWVDVLEAKATQQAPPTPTSNDTTVTILLQVMMQLQEEIQVLRWYGNKECTHMADEELARRRKEKT